MEDKLEAALKWIVGLLNRHNMPYQIAGGFAAYLYGATRPVNDLDVDIPNEKFVEILSEIKDYITFGPARYKDEKWDLDLITLDYYGQIIDVSGAFGAKIYDEQNKVWQAYPCSFSTAQVRNIFGMDVRVMDPKDLAGYKKLLNGEHQKIDISVIEKYLKS